MAERICGPAEEVGGDVVDRIGELVDQSLVRSTRIPSHPRFSMLETIREYAAEMLAARGETGAIRARHADAMVDLAELAAQHLSGSDQRVWLDRLEREHDNLRAALDRAIAAPRPAVAVAPGVRAVAVLAAARLPERGPGPASTPWRRMDWDLAVEDSGPRSPRDSAASRTGSPTSPTATRWYDEALAIRREQGDQAAIANALYNRAYADMIVIVDRRRLTGEPEDQPRDARGGAGALPGTR